MRFTSFSIASSTAIHCSTAILMLSGGPYLAALETATLSQDSMKLSRQVFGYSFERSAQFVVSRSGF